MGKHIPTSEYEILVSLYAGGVSLTVLGDRYGVSYQTIGNILRRQGFRLKKRGEGKKLPDEFVVKVNVGPRVNRPKQKRTPEAKFRLRLARYRITRDEFEYLTTRAAGVCELCGQPFGVETPNIDHDHKTGKVRGLIHGKCNRLLGSALDSPETLLMAVEYLKKHRQPLMIPGGQ